MAYRRLIIDGYSLLHRDPETKGIVAENLRRAREVLIEKISRTATAMADHVILVFDGQQAGGTTPGGIQAIEIVYSSSGQTADTVIERMVRSMPDPANCLVITNDRRERETVLAAGVQTMSCAVFLEECQRMTRQQHQSMRRQAMRQPGPKLGDFFPKEEPGP